VCASVGGLCKASAGYRSALRETESRDRQNHDGDKLAHGITSNQLYSKHTHHWKCETESLQPFSGTRFQIQDILFDCHISGGFRAARLPRQATLTARAVSSWVEKNPVPPPNRRALDWSVVLTVGRLRPIVPQDN